VTELYVPDPALLGAVAVGIAAWFVLLSVLWVIRSPKQPRPGPESTELGSEPPAVVNLLTHNFRLGRDAVPATLLDLAARGVVEIEDRGLGNYFCRLDATAPARSAYEEKLIGHLRSVAVDGVVPAEALTTGPQDASKLWWESFRKKVVEESKASGLSRNLWNLTTTIILGLAGAAVVLLFYIAIGFNDLDDVQDSGLLTLDTIAMAVGFFVLITTAASQRQTDTAEGRQAAVRWLGVKRSMEGSPSFGAMPPTGVIVWERHLAYAAAMSVATRVTGALPMGAESDTEAWTGSSGQWRRVEVRYPRFRPGWGRHPVLAVLLGALGSVAGFKLVAFALNLDMGSEGSPLAALPVVLGALGALILLRSLPQILLGLMDVFARKEVSGRVLRCRVRSSLVPYPANEQSYSRYFVALDDGHTTAVDAYRVSAKKYPSFYQGQEVVLTISPRLGYLWAQR
jgi:hypothetical protein